MRCLLTGVLIKGALATDNKLQSGTVLVERVAAGEVKRSYINLRAFGKMAETIVAQSNAAGEGVVQLLGTLDVEQVEGLNVPFLSVENVKVMPDGAPHASLVYGIGNVTRDAEVRELNESWRVMSTGIASNRKEGGREKTSFFSISMFAKVENGKSRANNIAQYVTKGKGLLVSGQLDVQIWNDRDDAAKQYSAVNIILDNLEFLPGGQRQEGVKDATPPYSQNQGEASVPSYVNKGAADIQMPEININEDEIPF